MSDPPEPHLDFEELRLFKKGVEEFNGGFFFECHDTLEEVWNGVRGPARDFFQGLIQISVGFYHLTGGNLTGAESMFARAFKRLGRYPERYFGFDLVLMRGELESWLARIRSGDVGTLRIEDIPKWRRSHEYEP